MAKKEKMADHTADDRKNSPLCAEYNLEDKIKRSEKISALIKEAYSNTDKIETEIILPMFSQTKLQNGMFCPICDIKNSKISKKWDILSKNRKKVKAKYQHKSAGLIEILELFDE